MNVYLRIIVPNISHMGGEGRINRKLVRAPNNRISGLGFTWERLSSLYHITKPLGGYYTYTPFHRFHVLLPTGRFTDQMSMLTRHVACGNDKKRGTTSGLYFSQVFQGKMEDNLTSADPLSYN